MKVIAQKVWAEPAVFIGLLVTLLLLVAAVLSDHVDWSVEHIIAILAPLLTALGIRPLVTPKDQPAPPTATTYARTDAAIDDPPAKKKGA